MNMQGVGGDMGSADIQAMPGGQNMEATQNFDNALGSAQGGAMSEMANAVGPAGEAGGECNKSGPEGAGGQENTQAAESSGQEDILAKILKLLEEAGLFTGDVSELGGQGGIAGGAPPQTESTG